MVVAASSCSFQLFTKSKEPAPMSNDTLIQYMCVTNSRLPSLEECHGRLGHVHVMVEIDTRTTSVVQQYGLRCWRSVQRVLTAIFLSSYACVDTEK